uniref:non-specific serine/threonine protein kinase n=1 Tax=Panagrellus redivivus TaxID=6233 RepID=A0A7E4WBT4_PANRE
MGWMGRDNQQAYEPDLIADLQWFTATHRGPSSTVDSAEYVPNPDSRLQSMLYVGETQHGLYAIPAVVDREAVPPKSLGPLLTSGPVKQVALDVDGNRPIVVRPQFSAKVHPNMVTYRTEQGEYLLLGYHRAPQLTSSDQMQFTDPSPFSINYRYITDYNQNSMPSQPYCRGRNCPTAANRRSRRVSPEISKGNPLIGYDQDDEYLTRAELLLEMWSTYPLTFMTAAAVIVSLVVATVYLFGRESGKNDRLINEVSRNSQSRSRANTGANDNSRKKSWSIFGRVNQPAPNDPEPEGDPNLPPGWISIGKIQYDKNHELGSGGQGTVVYKGRFDGRDAAVKRVLASVLTYVDREIKLLRESDSHPNVIRYFCSEADDHFRFIALELCECSLRDYVFDEAARANFKDVDSLDMMKQATDGLLHLHQMNIVHRDVKPQNILLTRTHNGQPRVLISDFGLCKKIQHGHASLSRMSGFVGTEGYIAPEMYDTDGTRVTHLVDVFSLGCVYYFVLTNGKHPFGDSIQRQSNILKGEYSLVALAGRETTFDIAALNLIESMIQFKPIQRPRLSAVLAHPMFWNKERQLQFYMDVSDRIEKEEESSDVLVRLEHLAPRVSRNWHHAICSHLEADLNKFRTYRGHSIRDLLRALRNKKHHYRELPPDVKESLGDIPNGYVHYWNSRFPRLLMHSYNALIVCAEEPAFATYYPTEAHSFCNRRLEDELDKDFVAAGTGSQLRHTTSTPALQGSPQKPRRSPAEAVNNWRDNSPSPGPSAPPQPTPPVHNTTPRGPQSANAAKKAKKAKKARALFNALPQVYEGTMGPDGDANDENASAPAEED